MNIHPLAKIGLHAFWIITLNSSISSAASLRIKASDPEIIGDHCNKLLQPKRLYQIIDVTTYNMDSANGFWIVRRLYVYGGVGD